jgi:hypothetical protein
MPVLVAATVAITSLLLASLLWKRWRRRRARGAASNSVDGNQPDTTPRGQFLALSDSIREALIRQFGTEWRAKTTEELSEDAQLEHALGPEPLRELMRFLDQVDHLKFAPERSNHRQDSLQQDLGRWKPQISDLVAKIEANGDGRGKVRNSKSKTARSST